MNNSILENHTICALATPAGGAIGVIRLSGSSAIEIADKVFHSSTGKKLVHAKTQTVHYGEISDNEENAIDDVLVTIFRKPHSYTGEDSVEISCHGSSYILRQIIQLLIDNGCKHAKPGEYTQRAYLNGKMDLSQAEAVADLIASTNRASHKMALNQLKGNFSSELLTLREKLLRITSLLELELDFSDHEELEFANRTELLELAEHIERRISTLVNSFKTGNALKKGIPVAIIGKTNVGKSTLLNRLLNENKAIVSDIHGTTRDVIEDTTEIKGITFRFIDTAGIRNTEDKVEQLGIELTYKKINEAEIILWLVDSIPSKEEINHISKICNGKKLILINNKIDKKNDTLINKSEIVDDNIKTISISAKYGTNIQELESLIYKETNITEITETDVIVTNARHYEALQDAQESIKRVINGLQVGISSDLVAEDLRICLNQLAEITGGIITTNEVLGNIFAHFCVGK